LRRDELRGKGDKPEDIPELHVLAESGMRVLRSSSSMRTEQSIGKPECFQHQREEREANRRGRGRNLYRKREQRTRIDIRGWSAGCLPCRAALWAPMTFGWE